MIFFSFIGLDAVSTAGDEVKDPQKTMPRAIIAALIVVTSFYILVAFAGLGTQDAAEFGSDEQSEAGLSVILENITGGTWASTLLAAGAVISIFSVTLVVMYGQTRILFAMGRDGLLPSMFAKVNPRSMTPVAQHDHRRCRHRDPGRFHPADLAAGRSCRSARWSHSSRCRSASSSCGCANPTCERPFKVPGYPVTPVLSVLACIAVLYGLRWQTWLVFGAWVAVVLALLLGLGPPPQRAQ